MKPALKGLLWFFGSALAFMAWNELIVVPYQLRSGLSEFEYARLQIETPAYYPAVFLGVSLIFVCCGVHGGILLIEILELDRGSKGYVGSNLGIRTSKVSHEKRRK